MPCTGSYVGADVCSFCHTKEFYKWYASDHAGAYVSLLKRRKHKDPGCLPCHTTGYGQPGGYDPDRPDALPRSPKELAALAKKPEPRSQNPFKGVGCECCHGGARRHLGEAIAHRKDPSAAGFAIRLRPGPAVRNCKACHNPDRPCIPSGEEDAFSNDETSKCKKCDGTGKVNGQTCQRCNGKGEITTAQQYFEAINHWDKPEPASLLPRPPGPKKPTATTPSTREP
jgi:hypothetical protein